MSLLALLAAFGSCVVIGVLSALMGLGGGLFLVPILDLLPGVSWQEAAATGLVCTLATSAAGSVAFDRGQRADLELVAQFELAAALGALIAVKLLVDVIPERGSALAFAAIVGYAALRMARRARDPGPEPAPEGAPERLGLGMLGCAVAGAASGLLGIGGGPIKVPVQTEVCRIPLRVALANSNLMVGITAGVGAAAYFAKGAVLAALVAPCALGIATGAYVGGRVAPRVPVRRLRHAFVGLLLLLVGRMLWKAAT